MRCRDEGRGGKGKVRRIDEGYGIDEGVEINMEEIKRIRGRTGGKEMWWV